MSALHIDYDSDDMHVDSDDQSRLHDADADADADSDDEATAIDLIADAVPHVPSLYSRPVCLSLLAHRPSIGLRPLSPSG